MIARTRLDCLYRKYNKRRFVSPDPLQFLYDYPDILDREIVGMVASSLAYGRVAQIIRSVDKILKLTTPSPRSFLERVTEKRLRRMFGGFKHRFTTGEDVADLLMAMKRIIKTHGSLCNCFVAGYSSRDDSVLPALQNFVDALDCGDAYLLPRPSKGSACKRLHLFLRWMVRKDAVDPGGWTGIPKSKLIVPLDVHMARISREMGLSHRKSANMLMAVEVTNAFKHIQPRDPVKYDFTLTRFGIHPELSRTRLTL